ncbi:MAG: glutamine--tRNA ligase/YqeY domain fusion protein [Defluviitaleaceae bacterium]|nr:glutamine--tRNA ligase/YqeY domain fusion protein [Defluviitaleaceae bacterium]MCL2263117.1 glutamine--tRNA ligase/YqeY domain fusion protein [Defluviitaleaceae bacterium]
MENGNHILTETGAFIHNAIQEDLKGRLNELVTRFPPEPSGYLHIGNAKAVYINFELAKIYGGKCNLRFDDTNPAREEGEYVKSIAEDIRWLGYDPQERIFFASDYFEKFYDCAVRLIEKGLAFVCDLTAEELRASFGGVDKPGTESPFRSRSVEENLKLFAQMKNGDFPDGSKTLRAKIDMASKNLNMRDPVIYRIARLHHHNTGDNWCIYPMYDFAHPLEDAFEGVTHSLCSIEFEDHRPIYDWYINNLDFEKKPRQIEFAKISISNTIMGKRFIKELVASGKICGWDDPRLVTLSGMRRRGYPPAAIREFLGTTGVSKALSKYEFDYLEHFVREHLAPVSKVVMAVLNPLKVVITNYAEGAEELLPLAFHNENDLGTREVPFCREIYIEREDFMEDPPKKFFRLAPGKEVRLKGAYFVTCTDVIKDADGNVTEIHCTYDPATKSGTGIEPPRKVKGTLHWVSAKHAIPITANLYDTLVLDAPDTESGVKENPSSLTQMPSAFAEPCLANATPSDRFQFMRNGYFCLDSGEGNVFNRVVSLKSSFKK